MLEDVSLAMIVQSCIVSAVYGLVFFVKKRQRNGRAGEPFKWRQMASTIVVGVFVGISYAQMGVTPDVWDIETRLTSMGATIALVDQVLKMLVAQLPDVEGQ